MKREVIDLSKIIGKATGDILTSAEFNKIIRAIILIQKDIETLDPSEPIDVEAIYQAIETVAGGVATLDSAINTTNAQNEQRFTTIEGNVTTLQQNETTTNAQNEQRFTVVEGNVTTLTDKVTSAEAKIQKLESTPSGTLIFSEIEKGSLLWDIDGGSRTYKTINLSEDSEIVISTKDYKSDGFEHYLLLWNSGDESIDVTLGYSIDGTPTEILANTTNFTIPSRNLIEISVVKVNNYGLVMTTSNELS